MFSSEIVMQRDVIRVREAVEGGEELGRKEERRESRRKKKRKGRKKERRKEERNAKGREGRERGRGIKRRKAVGVRYLVRSRTSWRVMEQRARKVHRWRTERVPAGASIVSRIRSCAS